MPIGPIPANSYDHLRHGYYSSTFYFVFETEEQWRKYYQDCFNPFTQTIPLENILGPPNIDN